MGLASPDLLCGESSRFLYLYLTHFLLLSNSSTVVMSRDHGNVKKIYFISETSCNLVETYPLDLAAQISSFRDTVGNLKP